MSAAADPGIIEALAEAPPPTNATQEVWGAFSELLKARKTYSTSAGTSSRSFEGSSLSMSSEAAGKYLMECHAVYKLVLSRWKSGCSSGFDPVSARAPLGVSGDFSGCALSV